MIQGKGTFLKHIIEKQTISKILTETDFIKIKQYNSMTIIKEDRDKYKPIYSTIETYIKKNHLYISNVHKIISSDSNELITNKVYNIYVLSSPLVHANNIVNTIHKELIKIMPEINSVNMSTVKENEEFTINYDTRNIANIFLIIKKNNKVKGSGVTSSTELITPLIINSIYYLPPEIELIDVYTKLYNNDDSYIPIEKELFKKLNFNTEQFPSTINLPNNKSCIQLKKDIVENIKVDLVKNFFKKLNDDIILIGKWAQLYEQFDNDICADESKIQIITSLNIDNILTLIKNYLSKITKNEIIYKTQIMSIPKDIRTNRFSFYIRIQTNKGLTDKAFLDVFNCSTYELIPYKKYKNYKLAIPYVILKFLFVDLWVLNIIRNYKKIDEESAKIKKSQIVNLINYFRKDNYDFTDVEFYGTYQDYNIYKKLTTVLNTDAKKFFPYYPYTELKNKGQYRVIKEY